MTKATASSEAACAASPRPRNSYESLHERLNAYALAAGAAGVGILALASPAAGSIVYTPANQTIPNQSSYALDVNHDGINDFVLGVTGDHSNTSTLFNSMLVRPGLGNGVEASLFRSNAVLAKALPPGVNIPSGHLAGHYRGAPMLEITYNPGGRGRRGNWLDKGDLYLGLAFQIDGQTHYGWARLSVYFKGGFPTQINALLTGYAYETVANTPIVAGQTEESAGPRAAMLRNSGSGALRWAAAAEDRAVPTLGLLALGAQGIPRWRREERPGIAS